MTSMDMAPAAALTPASAEADRIDRAAFMRLSDAVRREVRAWQKALGRIQPPYAAHYRAIADQFGVSRVSVRRRHDAWRRAGGHWSALVNRAKEPKFIAPGEDLDDESELRGLPEAFKEHVLKLAEQNQRKTRPMLRKLRSAWQAREPIPGYEGHPNWPLLPRGWSEVNLYRIVRANPYHRFHIQLARRGEIAARAQRPCVLTTRRGLWVGSHLMFDDVWHDLFVADANQIGRPLELGVLDYFSACYMMRGGKIRQPEARALLEADMRLFLVAALLLHGYNPRGTALIVEHGTAVIRDNVERVLFDATGGVITVERSGVFDGRARSTSQWGTARGGNPNFKAALESIHNLLHNETAHLPAQAGRNRDCTPEETHHLLKYSADLLGAMQLLPAAQAGNLRLPILTRAQWEDAITAIVARINGRTDHRLEGWDQNTLVDPMLLRERRMSPAEVYARGRSELQPIPIHAAAEILYGDLAVERTIRRRRVAALVSEVSSDALIYDVHPLGLADGEKVATVVNPFQPAMLWVYDARGRFIGVAQAEQRVRRDDAEALHHAMGKVEKIHSELIEPFRKRHTQEARERKALIDHNNRVLSGRPATREELERERTDRQRRAAISGDEIDQLTARPEATPLQPESDDLAEEGMQDLL